METVDFNKYIEISEQIYSILRTRGNGKIIMNQYNIIALSSYYKSMAIKPQTITRFYNCIKMKKFTSAEMIIIILSIKQLDKLHKKYVKQKKSIS